MIKRGWVDIVLDSPYGDCGKGRYSDILCALAYFVIRFQGGANSGHTVVVNGKKLILHAIPSGVLRLLENPDMLNVMARGMVLDLDRVAAEMRDIADAGVTLTPENLMISYAAHLTLPYHIALEAGAEGNGSGRGSTKRGISTTYAFKDLYQGIRLGDLRNLDRLRKLVTEPLAMANAIIVHHYGRPAVTLDEVMAVAEANAWVLPFLGDEIHELNARLARGENGVIEGAQSLLLDKDVSPIYPFTTSSTTITGGIHAGCGIHPSFVRDTILVIKAYNTRVGGSDKRVTLIEGDAAEQIVTRGQEVGASTGRRRDPLWADDVIARYTAMVVHPTKLAINKADVLTGIPELKICNAYSIDGTPTKYLPSTLEEINRAEPMYEVSPGWTEDFSGATHWDDLPVQAQLYLNRIADPYGCNPRYIGTGPGREDLILV